MPEEYKLEGKKFPIRDPKDDGLRLVQEVWGPSVKAEGSTAHWTYICVVTHYHKADQNDVKPGDKLVLRESEEVVGEAWFYGRPLSGTWFVRIKEKV